ncbi:MAG: serine/threonine protein kinase [Planctomycetota bacterium]|nr:serine/threonine protein kinase [Planctomycetota bacterium]
MTRRVQPKEDSRRMPGTDKQKGEETPPPAIPTVSLGPPPSQQRPTQPPARVSPLPPRQPGTPPPQPPVSRAAQLAQQQRSSASSQQTPRSSASGPPPVGEQTEVPQAPVTRRPQQIEYRAEQDPSLAETQDMDPVEVEKPPEPVGGQARISFGQAAVNLKLVNAAQIQECVNVQRALLAKGQRVPLLGQILVQRGYLDKPGVEKIKSYQQMYQLQDKIPGYQLAEKLGQGAMGTVYKAKQVRMDRFVAIKVLQPELAANSTIKQRFLQEARASARLNHPNVITGIDAGEVDGLCYFAMEYVEGKTLQQLVKERGAMDERQALDAILQVARALEHAEKTQPGSPRREARQHHDHPRPPGEAAGPGARQDARRRGRRLRQGHGRRHAQLHLA